MKRLDLTGQRFGRWTAMCLASKMPGDQGLRWRCRCDCGKRKSVTSGSLVHGKSTSCGCRTKEYLSSEQRRLSLRAKLRDVSGQRFGMLEALGDVEYRRYKYGFKAFRLCMCDCKTTLFVEQNKLLDGRKRHCGCGKARPVKGGLFCCARCKTWKPMAEFSLNKSAKSGIRDACRECRMHDWKKYRPATREYQARYRKIKADLCKLWSRRYAAKICKNLTPAYVAAGLCGSQTPTELIAAKTEYLKVSRLLKETK